MYFGVDVGRGHTKVTAGKEVIKFPSYVAPGKKLDIETGRGNNLEQLKVNINRQKYFIGELAKRHGGSREFQKEKVNHRNTIPLLLTAISYISGEKFLKPKIVVGLPISDYSSQGKKFEEKALGNYEVELLNHLINLEILRKNILSFPEGAGVIWNHLLNNRGKIIKNQNKRYAVIDIGWKTCNFAVLDNLQYDDSLSGTIPMGLSKAFKPFYKRISRKKIYFQLKLKN